MNQILAFQNVESSRKQTHGVIKFFAFSIVIFAIILLAEGIYGYNIMKNSRGNISTPEMNIERNGDNTILKINSNIGIKKVIYSWNDGIDNTIEKNDEKNVEINLETTIGTNDLNISIIDSKGNKIKYESIKIAYEEETPTDSNTSTEENDIVPEQDLETAISNDKTKPVVKLSSTKGKVVINASDDVKMSYITYSWNGGEENKVTGLSEDEKSLNVEIDVIKGNNQLTVKAYDKAGNIEEITKEVHGTSGPKISVKKENGQLVVNVTAEFNITKITYNFNNKENTIENINSTSYDFKLDLVDGENFIIMQAYEDNIMNEYKGKTTK